MSKLIENMSPGGNLLSVRGGPYCEPCVTRTLDRAKAPPWAWGVANAAARALLGVPHPPRTGHRFNPDRIDGGYGKHTPDAIVEFQVAYGLAADPHPPTKPKTTLPVHSAHTPTGTAPGTGVGALVTAL